MVSVGDTGDLRNNVNDGGRQQIVAPNPSARLEL